MKCFYYFCKKFETEMSLLVISCTMGKMMSRLPRKLYINNRFVGVMQNGTTNIEISSGNYALTIQSTVPLISTTTIVSVKTGVVTHLDYGDREKIWNILFTIDIILSIAQLFFTLPNPWHWIYNILTNTFFAIWLIYEWRIRKRYYKTNVYYTIQ